MAYIQCDFFSEVLKVSTQINVILPDDIEDFKDKNGKIPVIYLLHGLSDNHTGWQRYTSVERYVQKWGYALVMPDVQRSFYTDMKNGYNYWTYVSEELPKIAENYFPISDKKEDNYVAGLSMGGYGAVKLALRLPDKFAAAASLSGAVDLARRIMDFSDDEKRMAEFRRIFGVLEKLKGSSNDLLYLLSEVQDVEKLPRLYLCCGTEDFLYQDNLTFKKICEEKGVDLTFEEEKAGHEWEYWDKKIQDVFRWFYQFRSSSLSSSST
ncbi:MULTISPECIES: alpha/beta hydrolase family protein [unclassified Halanaerobium]|uniref:alpha/beta hydrolase n=1 Tax=unclassified Halanaerobium TaxID=2641197 RepID=UPI000DF1766C|nr:MULTISPECIES: alpha/beta hydrolase family protein [unclassified Halanaerobium]RCW50459.1 S-formylglutathione hydrolase FrmB [Halanaerobium sp. MA284_MarDTE_T2]RCW85946.1 S-formylglutathione hydrolase FrmB [Halanaerobium sp. DL-01]